MSARATRLNLRIEGMHCASCAMAIDMELEDLPGVAEARTSYARGTTEVIFDPQRVAPDAIVAAVRKAGYAARPSA
jgi:copper chaperone CopZ